MPHFHFNVFDGVTVLDAEGVELASLDEARTEAIALAGQMLKDYPERVRSDEEWRIEVINDTGLLLFRLDFTVSASPAVTGGQQTGWV